MIFSPMTTPPFTCAFALFPKRDNAYTSAIVCDALSATEKSILLVIFQLDITRILHPTRACSDITSTVSFMAASCTRKNNETSDDH